MRFLENRLAISSGYTKLKSPIHPHRFYDPYLILDHEKVMELYPRSLEVSPIDVSYDWPCVDGLLRSNLLEKWGKPAAAGNSIASQIANNQSSAAGSENNSINPEHTQNKQ